MQADLMPLQFVDTACPSTWGKALHQQKGYNSLSLRRWEAVNTIL